MLTWSLLWMILSFGCQGSRYVLLLSRWWRGAWFAPDIIHRRNVVLVYCISGRQSEYAPTRAEMIGRSSQPILETSTRDLVSAAVARNRRASLLLPIGLDLRSFSVAFSNVFIHVVLNVLQDIYIYFFFVFAFVLHFFFLYVCT